MLSAPDLVTAVRTLGGMPEEYLSQSQIARVLGVTRQALSVWRARYEGTPTPFPEPDVQAGTSPGWRASRIGEIRAWRDTLPGQGAGGGRPRKHAGHPDQQEAPVKADSEGEQR